MPARRRRIYINIIYIYTYTVYIVIYSMCVLHYVDAHHASCVDVNPHYCCPCDVLRLDFLGSLGVTLICTSRTLIDRWGVFFPGFTGQEQNEWIFNICRTKVTRVRNQFRGSGAAQKMNTNTSKVFEPHAPSTGAKVRNSATAVQLLLLALCWCSLPCNFVHGHRPLKGLKSQWQTLQEKMSRHEQSWQLLNQHKSNQFGCG